jgi:hypothetical protein
MALLNMLIKETKEKEEQIEELKEKETNSKNTGKGSRETRVSGESLKTQMKNGMIPLQ